MKNLNLIISMLLMVLVMSCSKNDDDLSKSTKKIVKLSMSKNDQYLVSEGSNTKSWNYSIFNEHIRFEAGSDISIVDKSGNTRPLQMISEDGSKYILNSDRDISLSRMNSRYIITWGLPSYIETIHVSGDDGYSYTIQHYYESVIIDTETGYLYDVGEDLGGYDYTEIGNYIYYIKSAYIESELHIPLRFDISKLQIEVLYNNINAVAFSNDYFLGFDSKQENANLLAKFYDDNKLISITDIFKTKYPDESIIQRAVYYGGLPIYLNKITGIRYIITKNRNYNSFTYYKIVQDGKSLDVIKLLESDKIHGVYPSDGKIYVFDDATETMKVISLGENLGAEVEGSTGNIKYYKTNSSNIYKALDITSGKLSTITLNFNASSYAIQSISVSGDELMLSGLRLSDGKSVVIVYNITKNTTDILDAISSKVNSNTVYTLTRIN